MHHVLPASTRVGAPGQSDVGPAGGGRPLRAGVGQPEPNATQRRSDPMKLNATSCYALRALIYLAGVKDNRPVASHVVAQACGAPERFLLKILSPLVGARVLYSLKGPNGGYRLVRPAKGIT